MLVKEGNRQEGLLYIQDNNCFMIPAVDCVLNRSTVHQQGTIYFTNTCLIFISSPNTDYSISIDYNAIGVHAICHNTDIYSKACVYIQVSDPNVESNCFVCYSPGYIYEADSHDDAEEFQGIEEILFSPEDSSQIDTLFSQITMYQSQTEEYNLYEDDILQTNGEVAFDCNVEELFLRAEEEFKMNSQD